MSRARKPRGLPKHERTSPGRRGFLQLGAGAALGVGLAGCGKEGPFPSNPIRMIVPYGAGGGTDLEARSIAPYLRKQLGVPVIVENQPGADGRVALSRFARLEPNGYTIAVYGIPSMILGEVLNDASYHIRDFTHLYAWIQEPQVLVVSAGRWSDFNAFSNEARAKRHSAGVTYLTSASRLAGLAMTRSTGIEFTWVPFGASGAAVAALLGGHVDFCITALRSSLSLVEAGQLEALLVFAKERNPTLPNVPVPPEFDLSMLALPIVRGAVAPAGLDPAVLSLLEAGFAGAVKDPEFLAKAEKSRIPIYPKPAADYARLVEEYYEAIEAYRDDLEKQGEDD